MSRRARVGLSPSLFPFLAVLVCTLGTLILLLALVAQNATTKAQRDAAAKRASEQIAVDTKDAQPKPTRDTVQRLIQEGEFRVTQLVSFRDSQTADLEGRRDQVTHLEDHIRRVREELARLNHEVQLATSETLPQAADEERLSDLKSQLERERDDLQELRESAKSKRPRVVIVPHKGPNGTDRRPVYLECTASGITIWPESSRIDLAELLATDKSANPVDAALRTVRLHAMQNYGDSIPPYPLLVVRPDGIETYIAAKAAMQDWDDQFGYELVPADVDLAFAQPDEQLKQKVEIAIREAVSNQKVRIAILGGVSGRGGSAGDGSPRTGTGSGSTGAAGRVRTLSAAALDREGRSGGFSDIDRTVPLGNQGSSWGSSATPSYGSASTGDATAVRRLDEHLQNAAEELADGQTSKMTSGATNGGGPSGATGAGGSSDLATGGAGAANAGDEVNNTSDATLGASPTGPKAMGAFQLPPSSSEPGQGTAATETNASPDGPTGSAADKSDVAAESDAKDPSAGQFATGSTNGSGEGGTQSSGGGNSSQSASGAAGAQASARGSADDLQQGTPSVNVSNATPPTSARKMIQRKGNNWAIPDNMAGINGTAVVRTIRVVCYNDRLVLLPPASGGATEMFGFSDGEIDRATLELASAVRDRIETWGPSLPGGRWQPRLEVEVKPDGSQRFQQLQSLMNGSGVEVTGRPSQ